MTDEPDGAHDWPHAVGAESKARQWRLARGIHDTEMRSGDKIDELLEEYSRTERADRPLTMAAIEELVSELKASKAEITRLRGLLEAAQTGITKAIDMIPGTMGGRVTIGLNILQNALRALGKEGAK